MNLVFAREHDYLKAEILRLAREVENRLGSVLRAISLREKETLEYLMEADSEIDAQEVQIEEDCLKILALHQPVARDLRFVVAILKINNDLERIGDIVANIADRGIRLSAYETPSLMTKVIEMGKRAQNMLKESIYALVSLDVKTAHEVIQEDDSVDRLNVEIIKGVIREISLSKTPEALLLIHSMARDLERIGDHATNIAEDVAYLVDGTIIRHKHVEKES
jgi:phosphate transport system protein